MAQHDTSIALAERDTKRLQTAQALAVGGEIKTATEYADRIRQLQGQAHILSPMAEAMATIAPGHVITPVIVVIDPTFDKKSGRGANVYHQPSIHKTRKVGQGRDAEYEAVEVSLNKVGLHKFIDAFGVNVHYPPIREFRTRYWWIVTYGGDLLTFDGKYISLPPGTASVDLQDGSADIGEWTPEAWVEAVRAAEAQKQRTPPDDQWKVKASVNGWTKDRVMQQRKFGLEMAETRALNRLARNLGLKQAYTIEELAKPFVIFRASYVHDVSDPAVRQMLSAAAIGARSLLFPGQPSSAAISHGIGDPTNVIDSERVVAGDTVDEEPIQTAPLPEDATEANFDEPAPVAADTNDIYHVLRVVQRKDGAADQYFIETKEGATLYTPDKALAKACALAAKAGDPREIPTEAVAVQGKTYRQIVEIAPVQAGLKL